MKAKLLIDLLNEAYGKKHSIETLVDYAISAMAFPAIALGKQPNQLKKDLTSATEAAKMPAKQAAATLDQWGVTSVYHTNAYVTSEIEKGIWVVQRVKEELDLKDAQALYSAMLELAGGLLALWVYTTVTPRPALAQLGKATAHNLEVVRTQLDPRAEWALGQMFESGSTQATADAKIRIDASTIIKKWHTDAVQREFQTKAAVYEHFYKHWGHGHPVTLADDESQYELVEELSGFAAMQRLLDMAGSGQVNLVSGIDGSKPKEAQWLLDNANALFGISESRVAELMKLVDLRNE